MEHVSPLHYDLFIQLPDPYLQTESFEVPKDSTETPLCCSEPPISDQKFFKGTVIITLNAASEWVFSSKAPTLRFHALMIQIESASVDLVNSNGLRLTLPVPRIEHDPITESVSLIFNSRGQEILENEVLSSNELELFATLNFISRVHFGEDRNHGNLFLTSFFSDFFYFCSQTRLGKTPLHLQSVF